MKKKKKYFMSMDNKKITKEMAVIISEGWKNC